MYRSHLLDVLRLLFLLQLLNYSCCEANDGSSTVLKTTRRSVLEKTLQLTKGVAGILTSPFRSHSHKNSIEKSKARGYGSILNRFTNKIHAIVPGTRWCGDGNIAVNDNDLGYFKQTDACCRQHDKCDFNIESGQSYANLKNDGLFTRSSCECDDAFYDCLKNTGGPLAYDIGHTYFTILGPQCINYHYPIVSCMEYEGLIIKKCVLYDYDMTKNKTYQWKDSPNY